MDVLENGSDRRALGRRTRIVIGGMVAAALIVAALVSARPHPHDRTAAPAALPSSTKPRPRTTPILVGDHVQIDTAYSMTTDGHEFVLTFDLLDHDGTRPRVSSGAIAAHPGFDRVAVAVLPGGATQRELSLTEVAADATHHVSLDRRTPARLFIAGKVTCDDRPVPGGDIALNVNGQQLTTRLPQMGGQDWATAVIGTVCG